MEPQAVHDLTALLLKNFWSLELLRLLPMEMGAVETALISQALSTFSTDGFLSLQQKTHSTAFWLENLP